MERTLRLLVLLAVIAIPRAVPSEDGSTGRADAGGLGYGPTEFLERWDRRYRLIDPEVESGPQPAERDYARAASELKKAILTGIADDQMYYRLGYCYEKMGDYDRALEAYLRAGERLRAGEDTGDLAFYLPFHLGLVHAKKGNCGDAVKEFERAHETGKDSAPLRNNLGYCYNRIYLKRRAIEEFQRAAALDPQCAAVFLNMGITQAELGDLVGAEASLRRALEINPRIEGGNYNLGLVLCTKGERGEAEEALRSAVADSPDDEKARLALAKLCATLGKNAEAREHARVAFSLDPALKAGNPELCALGKGRASGTEDKERGEQVGEREYLARAQRRIAQGDLRGAGELYDAILERNPKSIQACLGLAYVNEFAGGRRYGTGFPAEECISLYRRAIEIQPR
jgi:tetratricopeptide (TPR) repeat protein